MPLLTFPMPYTLCLFLLRQIIGIWISHVTTNGDNLLSYFNLSNTHRITVENGNLIPIHGCGHTILPNPFPPLSLNNVIHGHDLIKNLISMRKFTVDNNVFVEFDPFNFFVKNFETGLPIMRCNSMRYLYPIMSQHYHSSTSHSSFPTLSLTLWHNCLGHPGPSILGTLYHHNLILGNKSSHRCSSISHFHSPRYLLCCLTSLLVHA